MKSVSLGYTNTVGGSDSGDPYCSSNRYFASLGGTMGRGKMDKTRDSCRVGLDLQFETVVDVVAFVVTLLLT